MDDTFRQVFARVFNVSPESLQDDSRPQTIPAWDSPGHLNLVLELEAEFNIQLSDEEVVGMVTFEAVRDTVNKRLQPAP